MESRVSMQNVPRLTFRILAGVPGLVHGVFTRRGGVSGPPCETLNASLGNGDLRESVLENLARIRDSLGLASLASSLQVHGDTINVVDQASRAPLIAAPSGDALATRAPGIGLMIKIADCQSIFLVDPEKRVVANVHSGWRGSVQNIAAKAVAFLRDRFGCDPAGMLAAVGPSLGPCCAEFKNFRQELPPEFHAYQSRPFYFDFWAITRDQLAAAGIRSENMEFSGRCTACDTRSFFSYRAERTTGRMAAVIGWAEDGRGGRIG